MHLLLYHICKLEIRRKLSYRATVYGAPFNYVHAYIPFLYQEPSVQFIKEFYGDDDIHWTWIWHQIAIVINVRYTKFCILMMAFVYGSVFILDL